MPINLGKYQHLVDGKTCACCATVEWDTSKPSRRRFLAASLAATAIPAALAVGPSSAATGDTSEKTATRVSKRLAESIGGTVDGDSQRLTALFKNIHQNPELGFMEVRTSGIVADELRKLGFEVKTGIGATGVVGILRNGDGPIVMYRADMDANAVEERTGLPYASKVRVLRSDNVDVPVGHMCGHDAHVVWMLGMAKVMAEHKGDWGGTLILVGQPAEELITGAKAMIDDGFYDRHNVPVPDFFIGMHTAPGPVGMAACAGGVRLAGTEQLDVVGHGSMPHLTKDPIMMAVAAATDYQIMLARTIDPQETAVLTIGSIQAGTDNNVIPESALLKLNLRYFNPAVREHMLKGINAIDNAVAQAYGMPDDLMPTVTLKGGSPPLVNTTALTERLAAPLKQLLGDDKVVTDFPPATGSEDCHLLMGDHKDIPFAFLIVGVADPQVFADARKQGKFLPYSAHNPNYVVDLAAIPVGAKAASVTVLELLAKV